ncbi:MAG: class I SAM-dependent methyltransferase [bacterium]|nr:class I SAM-dependent methyltransferase [bacterium]
MKKLTERKYWEKKYQSENGKMTLSAYESSLPASIGNLFVPYVHSKQLEIILKNVSLKPKSRIVEIGSAPGYFITELATLLKAVPFGIEYSKSGAEMNRKIFRMHGYPDKNVIEADFFSESFMNEYEESFDMVVSRGFIEHFDDPSNVVGRHIKLLKTGGYLVVIIPNKTGINSRLSLFFNKDSLNMHNLSIMKIKNFSRLFSSAVLEKKVVRYFGIFDIYQFNPSTGKKKQIHSLLMKLQKILYPLYSLTADSQSFDSADFSPMLIYIGVKIK